MNNDNIYSKLTPSAKDALNELTEEFKEELLLKAYTLAQERETANREISLRDILEAKQPPSNLLEKEKNENKRKYFALLLSFSGAVYAVAGILIYLFQNNKFSIENDLGLIIAIIGILFSLVGFLYGQLAFKRFQSLKSNSTDFKKSDSSDYEIVKRWQIIESLAKKFMTEPDQNEAKNNSVSFLIRFLSHKIAKDESEFLKIRGLLQLRNKILHEEYKVSETERNEYLEFADELIERLEMVQGKNSNQEKTLKVIKATYWTAKKSFDATNELNQLIKNNRLEFIINNEIVGDPEYGVIKTMTLEYEINGVRHKNSYQEGVKVIIDSSNIND